MLLFKVNERWLAAAACLAFVLLTAITVYLMQSTWLLANLLSMNNFYVMISFSSSTILFFILWFFGLFPKFLRVYAILLASLAFVPLLGVLITLKMTVELRHPILYMREQGNFMLNTSACFAEETQIAIIKSRQGFLKNEHAQTIEKGIGFVKETFDVFSDTTETFTEGILAITNWLDGRGINCSTFTALPYRACLNHCEKERQKCRKIGFGILCEIVRICHLVCRGLTNLTDYVCSLLMKAAVNYFGTFKKIVANIIIKHTSMRVGFKLGVNTTDHVEDNFVFQLKNLTDSIERQTRSLADIVQHLDRAVRIGVPIIFCLFPIGYMLMFMYGTNTHDNKYIDPDLETDDLLMPLKRRELKKITYMSQWAPSWRKLGRTLHRSLAPGFLIAIVLGFAYLLQKSVNEVRRLLLQFLTTFDGKIFHIEKRTDNQGGIAQIVDILFGILDDMQDAADLRKVVRCVTPKPPAIQYQYWPFAVSFTLVCVFMYAAENLTQLPVIMCSRFYRTRYVERHLHLRYHILMRRIYGETDE